MNSSTSRRQALEGPELICRRRLESGTTQAVRSSGVGHSTRIVCMLLLLVPGVLVNGLQCMVTKLGKTPRADFRRRQES